MTVAFQTAVQHHQGGRLDQAELMYRQIWVTPTTPAGLLGYA